MTAIDVTVHDPFVAPSRSFFQNPYPQYDEIRQHGNLVWTRGGGDPRWIVVGYDTGVKVFNDPRFSVELPESHLQQMDDVRHNLRYKDLLSGLTKFMLAQDPPQHTRVRKLANKAFTRSEVTALHARLSEIIESLLSAVVSQRKMDLIEDFAFPLPITVISEVLGLPADDRARFKEWSHAIISTTELNVTPEALDAGGTAATELFDYLKVLISERRQNPKSDLLSAFVQAEDEGDKLSLEELLANMLLLIIAGHETTVNLIGNGMLTLLQNPQSMERLKTQPELLESAIEEMLRYQSPLQITERYAREDFQFEGQQIKKDQKFSIIIGALNRDPHQFESPHLFDIERKPNKHLAFGQGIHFCLGAPLARFEAKLAFSALLSKLGQIRLTGVEPEFKPIAGFRGLESLPITFDTI